MIWILFVILLVALFIGMPVSISIGVASLGYLLITGSFEPTILVSKMIDGVSSFSLMALPLFVLAGDFMSYGCTPRLMRLANMIVKRIPGGLGCTGVVSSALFGTVSGSGVATTAAIGGIVEPEMIKNGYKKGFAASIMAAAGTLGTVIPPSVTLVIYATTAGVSIGKMFMAGVLPGIVETLCLCVLCILVAKKRGYRGEMSSGAGVGKIILDALPPLMMPIFVLGGVLSGFCTATEASAVAAIYSFVLAVFVYRELKIQNVIGLVVKAIKTSASILLIMAVAEPFGWILTMNNVPSLLGEAMQHITSNGVVLLIMIILLVLFLGTFMEATSLIILLTPILLPIMRQYNMDPIHFGIMMKVGLSVGACTPPLAVCLFTSCKIANCRIDETFPDILYVCGTMVIALLIIAFVPQLSTWLPSMVK